MRINCNEVDLSQCKMCENHDVHEGGIPDVCGLNGVFCVDVERRECSFSKKYESDSNNEDRLELSHRQYTFFDNVTRSILDLIQVGDYIKCNDWKKPMKVIAVSENYFVMIEKIFGDTYYSVCEKKIVDHDRNSYTKGHFRIGTDDNIFGYPTGYQWTDEGFLKKYLNEFEQGETALSVRTSVNLKSMSIKRAIVRKHSKESSIV